VDLATLLPLAIRASIVLAVFGLGLGASPQDASYLFRRPRQLLRSLLPMNVVMPLVASALAAAFALHPAVKIALVELAVSPVPPILPRKQLKAGGHASYAIGLLVAAALLAIVFVPLAVGLLGWAFGKSVHVPMPIVAKLVTLTVLAPLTAGVLVRHVAPSFATRAAGPISTVSTVLLVAAVLPILVVSGPAILSLIGNGTLAALAAFCVVGLAVGHRLGGPSPAERVVLALATASRHPGVSVAVASATFPDQKLAAPAVALYLVVATIVSAIYLAWFRRRQAARAAGAEPVTSKRSAA
jgi:BASS family bile acid:Na+ symporter